MRPSAGLTRAYMQRGDYAEAIPLLEQWVEKDPDNSHFRQLLETAKQKANE